MPWNPNKRRPHKRKRMSNQAKSEGVPDYLQARINDAKYIVGADECGWGCVAGPIVVAACALVSPYTGPRFKDSKKYSTEKLRIAAEALVKEHCAYYEVVSVSATAVKLLGPAEALRLAYAASLAAVMERLEGFSDKDVVVVVDGNNKIKGFEKQHYALPRADNRLMAVSAASILGKVHRDNYMTEINDLYPDFGFRYHKGYLTANHYEELRRFGVTLEHRRNIAYVQECLEKTGKYNEHA